MPISRRYVADISGYCAATRPAIAYYIPSGRG